MPSNPASRAMLNTETARKYALILFINNIFLSVCLILVCVAQDWSQVIFAAVSCIVGFCMLSERSNSFLNILCFLQNSNY